MLPKRKFTGDCHKFAIGLLSLALLLLAAPAFGQAPNGWVHQVFYDYNKASWTDTNITLYFGSQFAYWGYTGITAFRTTPDGQLHVFYPDINQNIRQFYFNGEVWLDEDLTEMTGGAPAQNYGTGIAVFSLGSLQYVYFTTNDQHIHEYSYLTN